MTRTLWVCQEAGRGRSAARGLVRAWGLGALVVALAGPTWADETDGKAKTPVQVADDYRVDVRASTYAQLFQRNLAPGANGAVLESQTLVPFYGYAFLRVQDVDLPWAKDGLNAELSVWGSLGLLPQPAGTNADGDLISAWAEDRQGPFHIKVGRQVTTPGSARYVRFDGAETGVRAGGFDLSLYGGWVALPRWDRPKGYYTLGTVSDALKDPRVLELQNRVGQWLLGARVGWVGTPWLKASLAFHEQHEAITYTNQTALAFRNLSADLLFTKLDHVTLGGRMTFDLASVNVAEARVYADFGFLAKLPISVDYLFQAPGLLLPASSILAAFGGQSFHELGAEVNWYATPRFRLIARLAGQAYVDRPGYRGSLRAQWVPDPDRRGLVIFEYQRVGANVNGYHNLRAAGRYRLTTFLSASLDGALYTYDTPVRNTSLSAMAFGSLEWAALPNLRFMLSGSLASTPYAAFDSQLLGRVVFELDGPSAGGGL